MNIGRPEDGERGGAVSAPMAIVVLAMLVALGLAVDGVRAAQGVATADAIAEEAARAGGQAVDLGQLAHGTAAVDPAGAVAAARAYLAAAHTDGRVRLVGPDRIRVEVALRRPTVLLALVGQAEITAAGSAEARLVAVKPRGGP